MKQVVLGIHERQEEEDYQGNQQPISFRLFQHFLLTICIYKQYMYMYIVSTQEFFLHIYLMFNRYTFGFSVYIVIIIDSILIIIRQNSLIMCNDYLTEMIASLNRVMPVNTNRERRVRYQHPKGAPDADLIFGSKQVTICCNIQQCLKGYFDSMNETFTDFVSEKKIEICVTMCCYIKKLNACTQFCKCRDNKGVFYVQRKR